MRYLKHIAEMIQFHYESWRGYYAYLPLRDLLCEPCVESWQEDRANTEGSFIIQTCDDCTRVIESYYMEHARNPKRGR